MDLGIVDTEEIDRPRIERRPVKRYIMEECNLRSSRMEIVSPGRKECVVAPGVVRLDLDERLSRYQRSVSIAVLPFSRFRRLVSLVRFVVCIVI